MSKVNEYNLPVYIVYPYLMHKNNYFRFIIITFNYL